MIDSIQLGARADALSVIRQAATHLIEQKKSLWELDCLTMKQVFHACQDQNVVVGYIKGSPVTAMVLTYYDPLFWPNVPPNQAGFIHKLSVVPNYQGKGIADQMVNFAKNEIKNKGLLWLRLIAIQIGADYEVFTKGWNFDAFEKASLRHTRLLSMR
ncbi:MAG: GNAT family N-acetyltransferase [Cyanobacteria bacterium P01_C01_bin.69]